VVIFFLSIFLSIPPLSIFFFFSCPSSYVFHPSLFSTPPSKFSPLVFISVGYGGRGMGLLFFHYGGRICGGMGCVSVFC
jgi:hypothetical protein